MKTPWLCGLVFLIGLTSIPTESTMLSSYKVVARQPLEGDGGWDYLTLDPAARLLYIAHATQVLIFNLDQKKIVGTIANTPGVHGVALAPALQRGFTSNGKENTVTVFDLATHAEIARIPVAGQNPDAIVFDSASGKVFTFNGRSKDASVIDPPSAKVIGHIALGGKPEFAVADDQGMLYDDLEDQSQVVQINTKDLSVKHRWPVAPCEEPSSLAIDAAHRRLFVGCGNQKMAVVNADDGHVLTTLPIGDHVDATVFDPKSGMIFNSNGDGTLTVIHEEDPDHYRVVDNVATQKGARTVALDPQTHRIYLVTAQFGAAPAATPAQPHPRPAIVPGTFTLLTVAAGTPDDKSIK